MIDVEKLLTDDITAAGFDALGIGPCDDDFRADTTAQLRDALEAVLPALAAGVLRQAAEELARVREQEFPRHRATMIEAMRWLEAEADRLGGRGPDQGDPDRDAVGAVRRSPDGRWLAILLPSDPHPARWHVQSSHGAGGYERPSRVAHWPVVGVVPWSPAAGVPLDGTVPTVATEVDTRSAAGSAT